MNHFYSISQFPGTTGQYYYTYFFRKYGIDATYTPLGCEPDQFDDTISRLIADPQTVGISVSMPYKQEVIRYCNTTDELVQQHGACNTVVVSNGATTGYNCDASAVLHTLINYIQDDQTVSILGNGAMAKMFYRTLTDSKYPSSMIRQYSRSGGNWDQRHTPTDVVINCTACGTASPESPLEHIPSDCTTVIDLAVKPQQLSHQAARAGVTYHGGLQFYHIQFIQQFMRYTDIMLTRSEVQEAADAR